MENTCRAMTFSFSIEDQNGNNIRCPSKNSPDAVRSSSSWSCGTSDSPADVEMEDLDITDNAQTSTPVLSVGNKTLCLPPLSESPLQKDGDSVSPMAQVINRQKGDSSHMLKSLMADSKSNKVKPNFSNIKSKMMSHAPKPFKKSGAEVPKTSSSSVPQTNKDQSMNHVAQLKASAKSTPSTPANVNTSIVPKRTRSSTNQESGPTSKSTSTKTSKDGSQEKKAQVNRISTTLTRPQTVSKGGSPNQGGKTTSGYESTKEDTQGSESLKKNLKMSRGRSGPQPSSARTGRASAARSPTAKLQSSLSAASKLKSGTTANNDCNTSDTPSPKVHLCTSEGGAQSRPAQFTASLTAPASKVHVKPKTQPKSSSSPQTNGHPKQGAGCKNMSSSSQSSVRSSSSLLKTPTARPVRPAATPTADKNKSRRTLQNLQPDLVPPESKSRSVEYCKTLCEKKNKIIQRLENMVRSNSRRFEAVAVVIKHLCAEQDEGMKQRRKLSQELITLREDLVSSSLCCEHLEQEKKELRAAFDGVLQKVQEQHRSDLSDLEERLKTFYSTEWEKVHQTYQEEADKCDAVMKQQLEELRLKHEALKKELEDKHMVEVDSLKHHFEESFKELKQSHENEMETLKTTLKKSEETLSNQIQELITENNDLKEKLKAEERRRKDLAERTQDSNTLYLEQELESLKVVLDIKNKQIHDQDKKLMQIDKLMERNVKLDECLKKLQQENEDLKARMDKHAALSKQLSTEQVILQESLQKESNVNKRLSMENEELLWKLHNGDLSSPRKVSPSPSLTLQSPRNSGMFSSPPISPR